MFLRRIFYYWQFIAAGVLPLWLLIGWSLFGAGGWQVLGVLVAAVVLGLGLLVVGLLIYARKDVRQARAVSWPDVGVLALWHALIAAVGSYAAASPWLPVLAIIVGIGAFWFAAGELYVAARRRVREVIDLIDDTARSLPTDARPGPAAFDGRPAPRDPNVIVIREHPTQP